MNRTFPKPALQLSLLLMLLCATVFSQNHKQVDNIVKTWPSTFSSSKSLANAVNTNFTTDHDKARAIFTWIAINVKYDLAKLKNRGSVAFYYRGEKDRQQKLKQYHDRLAENAVRSGKGICQDYAQLFRKVCGLAGLQCIDIPGTAKTSPQQIGRLPAQSDHIWNAVKLDGIWQLVDVTWGAGSVDSASGKFVAKFNDGYFCTDPELFFVNHYPEDPRLAMTAASKSAFANLPLYYASYIQSQCEIVSPASGILKVNSATVPFRIADLAETDRISYAVNNEKYARSAKITRNGNMAEFDILLGNHTTGYVTLYINNRSLASYKIMR